MFAPITRRLPSILRSSRKAAGLSYQASSRQAKLNHRATSIQTPTTPTVTDTNKLSALLVSNPACPPFSVRPTIQVSGRRGAQRRAYPTAQLLGGPLDLGIRP